jgi:hypothetical protein
MVAFTNRVVAPPHVLVRHLDGEAVLLNLETERYFGLDATGSRMWELVTTSPNIDEAYSKLAHEFDVQPELLRQHLVDLVKQLVDNGLLTVSSNDVGTIPAI